MEDHAEECGVGSLGPEFRVMPRRDRVRHFRRENLLQLAFGVCFTSFMAWGASEVPRAIITGVPTTVNDTTVRDWSTVNADAVIFQCVTTGLFVLGFCLLRRCWIDGRRTVATFPHAVQREWTVACRDSRAVYRVSGFGTSGVTRRLRVESCGSSLRSFRRSADRGARLTVLLDGTPAREIVTKPSSEYDKERAIQVDVPPGVDPSVRTSVDSEIAARLLEWSVEISLLGDPNPPAELVVSCDSREPGDRLTPSGQTRR
jgi:hypothetical protein